MNSVFLNLVLILFPFLCHFIYMIYSKTMMKNEDNLFFDLAILSSCYLYFKYGSIVKYDILFIIIILFLAIYKKRFVVGILLSVYLSYFIGNSYDINIYLLIGVSLITFLIGFYDYLSYKYSFVLYEVILMILILVFNYSKLNFSITFYILIKIFFIYLLYMLICKFYNKLEVTVNTLLSLDSILKEKTLYESLFKITHEIKNPLAVCKGYLDMFDSKDEKKVNKYISIIDQEIDRTLLLLNDFSDISKINIEMKPIDATMLMEDICDEVSLILGKNVDFSFDILSDEILINGDYNRLKQVIINAVKNSKESIVEDGKITITTKKKGNNYVISIKDTGCGMDKDTLKRIGTPFYTTKKNGTGLGVCLSREIIDRHKGTINYRSKVGVGTTCIITLPI